MESSQLHLKITCCGIQIAKYQQRLYHQWPGLDYISYFRAEDGSEDEGGVFLAWKLFLFRVKAMSDHLTAWNLCSSSCRFYQHEQRPKRKVHCQNMPSWPYSPDCTLSGKVALNGPSGAPSRKLWMMRLPSPMMRTGLRSSPAASKVWFISGLISVYIYILVYDHRVVQPLRLQTSSSVPYHAILRPCLSPPANSI